MLKGALRGTLSAEHEAWLTGHLESCESCAKGLEMLAAEAQFCREATCLLAADAFDAELQLHDQWSFVDFGVEYLDASDDPSHLGRLGTYEIVEMIGRGGMGIVLKGFDAELKRYVAIKALSPHLAHSTLARKRFAREAQAAAAVVHPHVIAIHQVQPNGRLPFIVMPFVAGESLAQRIASQGHLELKEVLRIGMQAAAGLAAAHGQGLVHRDVKPANILLERGVERAVLTDFGLARAADDVAMTRLGIIAGTPQYMSPEQARGENLDQRSDLFSLGCILYEMATGVSPFRADSTIATLRRLVDERPQSLSVLAPELPKWFVRIVDGLLEKDPKRRFGSATEVGELLAGCLAHVQQPAVAPVPPSLIDPPFASRLKSALSFKIGAVVMLTTVLILAGIVASQKETPEPKSGDGKAAALTKHPGEKSALESPSERSPGPNDAVKAEPKRVLRISTEIDVQKIACSPDGKLIAIANGNPTMIMQANGRSIVANGWQPAVQILDSHTGDKLNALELVSKGELALLELAERAPPFEVAAIAFSPDSSLLAIGTTAGQVKLFDPRTGRLLRSLDDPQGKLTDQDTPEEFHELPRAQGRVKSLAFSPDGSLLAIAGETFRETPLVEKKVRRLSLPVPEPGRVKVWRVAKGELQLNLVRHSQVNAVAFSPAGQLLATVGRVGHNGQDRGGSDALVLWTTTGENVREVRSQTNGGIHSIAMSPDGTLVAIGAVDFDKNKDRDPASGLITLARVGSGIVEWSVKVPGWAEPICFVPDGKSIAILHGKRAVRIINADTGAPRWEMKPTEPAANDRWNSIDIFATTGRLVIGGVDQERNGFIELWNLGQLATLAPEPPKVVKLLRERADLVFEEVRTGQSTLDAAVRACKDLAEVDAVDAARRLLELSELGETMYKAGVVNKSELLAVEAAYELIKERKK
jgi:serine/threonine-protein kinase